MNIILVYNTKGLSQINYSNKEKSNSNYLPEEINIPLEERFLIVFSMFNSKDVIVEEFINKVYRFSC